MHVNDLGFVWFGPAPCCMDQLPPPPPPLHGPALLLVTTVFLPGGFASQPSSAEHSSQTLDHVTLDPPSVVPELLVYSLQTGHSPRAWCTCMPAGILARLPPSNALAGHACFGKG